MNWRESLSDALSVVRPEWPLIVLLGIGMAVVTIGVWKQLLAPIGLGCFFIQIIVFGQITARLVSGRTPESVSIIKAHFLNYVLAVLVIGVPLLFVGLLIRRTAPSLIEYVFWRSLAHVAVAIVTIYALPIVFLERKGASAVVTGVSFIGRNFAPVRWAAAVVAIAHLFRGVAYLKHRMAPSDMGVTLIVLASVLVAFSLIVSFVAALSVLLERRELAEVKT